MPTTTPRSPPARRRTARNPSVAPELNASVAPELNASCTRARESPERAEALIERRLGMWPTDDAEEVDYILRPRRRNSALSYAQRQAVERRAAAIVVQLLEAEGWTVRDVGAT